MNLSKPVKRAKPKRRPRRQRKGSKAALAREADRLWSKLVRARGACEFPGEHAGPLQGAHGFSRRYRNTRWVLLNGFALCSGCHVRTTHDPIRWDEYLRAVWGQPVYNELRLLALRTTPPDVAAALDKLRDEAKARGIE